MIFLTSPGKTYSVNSVSGCTISAGGTTLATIPANVQTTFIAPEEEVLVSDNNAIIVEVTGVGAGGSGGTGGSGGSGGPIDLTGVALLEGGNTFTGDQIINGDLTVSGDVTAEGEYNGAEVIETTDTTITPESGKYYKYTGTEGTITVVAPVWIGYATISYLETAEPVELEGVTWSPAKPSLTGAGPFVYTLACSEPGMVLASVMNYSVATAEAIQKVVPIAWSAFDKAPTATGLDAVAVGDSAVTSERSVVVGANSSAVPYSVVVGEGATASGYRSICLGRASTTVKDVGITIGTFFADTAGSYTCATQGTGSITIGAGANTLNTKTTVDGVETTVESSNSVTIGCKAENKGADSVVIGAQAKGTQPFCTVIGAGASTDSNNNAVLGYKASAGSSSVSLGMQARAAIDAVAIGKDAKAQTYYATAVGTRAGAVYSGIAIGHATQSKADFSIAIGSNATVDNTTNSDNTVTQSENTIVIGASATASAPNAVVIGAGASVVKNRNIAIGYGAKVDSTEGLAIGAGAIGGYYSTAIGHGARSTYTGVAIGTSANGGNRGIAIGYGANAAVYGTSIGMQATGADDGVVVFSSTYHYDGGKTQLYFSGANTPLANEYYNGEAFMGYTVTDKDKNVLACGTRRLSELFTDNTLTQPASLDENGEWVQPKVFHPSDLDLTVEEPQEPEDVTITIPEPALPEPYTPLPVYPIVEPEIEDIPSEV